MKTQSTLAFVVGALAFLGMAFWRAKWPITELMLDFAVGVSAGVGVLALAAWARRGKRS